MTRTARRTAGVLAPPWLALAAAGCGGDDSAANDAYVSEVNSIQTEFVSAYQRVASEITTSSTASEDAATLEKLESRDSTMTIAQLRDVEAPDERERAAPPSSRACSTITATTCRGRRRAASANEARAADARARRWRRRRPR